MKSKKASWTGITLAHPQDGTTAVVTEVSQRKVRGQDKWCWWLTLLWSDGFVKQYNEGTLAANTWAPTISATALRIFLKITVQMGYQLWKFDVKTAFLLAVASGKYYCFYPALFRLACGEVVTRALRGGATSPAVDVRQKR